MKPEFKEEMLDDPRSRFWKLDDVPVLDTRGDGKWAFDTMPPRLILGSTLRSEGEVSSRDEFNRLRAKFSTTDAVRGE